MNLFEAAKLAAREALADTGGGFEYEAEARRAIARLEAKTGEKLIDADVRLILDAPFNGANAGLRDPDYEAALAAQAEKDAAS